MSKTFEDYERLGLSPFDPVDWIRADPVTGEILEYGTYPRITYETLDEEYEMDWVAAYGRPGVHLYQNGEIVLKPPPLPEEGIQQDFVFGPMTIMGQEQEDVPEATPVPFEKKKPKP